MSTDSRWRTTLAAAIAPSYVVLSARVQEALIKLDALGVPESDQPAVVEAAARISAYGIDDGLLSAFSRIAATRRLNNSDLNLLAFSHGINVKIRPDTLARCHIAATQPAQEHF